MATSIKTRIRHASAGEQVQDTGQNPASFPVVGIGASAGGLAAFEAFFSGMPADRNPGMAFVLVQHLAPDHESLLTEIIQRYTRQNVVEVVDGMVVQPDHVYIIAPNCDMAFLNGALHLMKPDAPRGQRLPIDFFFRSLAQDLHERAIGIILSGTGSDGTLGVRDIKGEGGLVLVQSPESTEYDGMPRSAIATGLVDYQLLPANMPRTLIDYAAHLINLPKPSVDSVPDIAESAMKKIYILLRARMGHDFSQYKSSTIYRQIHRRLVVHQIDTLDEYVRYLQETPSEVDALFRNLLIGVTGFFRDPEAFRALEEIVIPVLFADRTDTARIRVWVPGCSTGEEAYSIAMLLQERQEILKRNYKLQVFATDIDNRAIAVARSGLYPASICPNVLPERLARFFTTEPDGSGYRIAKVIRDMVVFSEQNIIDDPPFSKIDLICCRNFLIYINGNLQKKLISMFHYALNPNGVLFLGTSESVGDSDNLFSTLDRKMKIYQRKDNSHSRSLIGIGRILPSTTARERAIQIVDKPSAIRDQSMREITEQAILQRIAPSSVLVDSRGDIHYTHGRTGLYLEPTPGEVVVANILKMAREGLQRALSNGLHNVVTKNETVRYPGLQVEINGHPAFVDLTILPVLPKSMALNESPLYLVVLEEAKSPRGAFVKPSSTNVESCSDDVLRIASLEKDLQANKEYLQTVNEELETANEEQKSSNEEMQSINEELQSTNEELETSKEELQSVNEELATINNELSVKVTDLTRINNDMNNLLSGTGIATIYVDIQLNVLRFTPAATRIVNLIRGDVGRPLKHIVTNLSSYDCLVEDLLAVLDTLVPRELEVRTNEGKWYLLRLQPYRTSLNVIEGAVLSFVDITEIVQMRSNLLKANELLRLAVVVRDSHDAVTVQDLEGRILAWNPSAERIYGWTEAEALKMDVTARIPLPRIKEETAHLHYLALAKHLELYPTTRLAKNGTEIEIQMTSTALINEAGKVYAIATTERPLDVLKDRQEGIRNGT